MQRRGSDTDSGQHPQRSITGWRIVGSSQGESKTKEVPGFGRSLLPRLYGNGDGTPPYSPRYNPYTPPEEDPHRFMGSLTPTQKERYELDYQI